LTGGGRKERGRKERKKKEGACPADRRDPRGNERETACGCSLRTWALKAKAGRGAEAEAGAEQADAGWADVVRACVGGRGAWDWAAYRPAEGKWQKGGRLLAGLPAGQAGFWAENEEDEVFPN